jgi:hypothetical protein
MKRLDIRQFLFATTEYDLSFNKKEVLSIKKGDDYAWPHGQNGHQHP